jgi:hypothetical protein
MDKQHILNEMRRTAEENGGKPLGEARFKNETGIGYYDWGQYWSPFSELQKEAGFTPNKPYTAYSDEFLITKMIDKMRKFGKYPSLGELRVEKYKDADFPFHAIKKQKQQVFIKKIVEHCNKKTGYDDIVDFCRPKIEKIDEQEKSKDTKSNGKMYEVYLAKSGRYYKIGKTKDSVRRGGELKIQLAEGLEMIHKIYTDDPSGIELNWQNRFKEKKMNAEWFNLSSNDVKAFKQRKYM